MQILIIGHKGMLGQELKKVFEIDGHQVAGCDREELDITNAEALKNKLAELKPELVINATAINAVDKIEDTPEMFELAKNVNGLAVGDLAKLCQERNATLVHYSSDYVFKGDNESGYAEDAVCDPVNKYGETKALGEKLLQDNTDQFYLIRLSKLFGKPAVSAGAKKSFVDTMIWLATEGGKTHLDLVDEEKSSPTYAPDLANLTYRLASQKLPYGIYHGSNSGTCTWYEWAKEIFNLKGITVDISPVSGDKFPRPARRPVCSELINTKLAPQRSWQEALKEYLS